MPRKLRDGEVPDSSHWLHNDSIILQIQDSITTYFRYKFIAFDVVLINSRVFFTSFSDHGAHRFFEALRTISCLLMRKLSIQLNSLRTFSVFTLTSYQLSNLKLHSFYLPEAAGNKFPCVCKK